MVIIISLFHTLSWISAGESRKLPHILATIDHYFLSSNKLCLRREEQQHFQSTRSSRLWGSTPFYWLRSSPVRIASSIPEAILLLPTVVNEDTHILIAFYRALQLHL